MARIQYESLKPIDPEHDFSLDPKLVEMLNRFKRKSPAPYESDQ
jgi:hypothetical protein